MSLHPADRRRMSPISAPRAGAIKADYLFGGALGVIVIVAMVLAIFYSLKPSRPTQEYRYKCDKCGNEFESNTGPQMDKNDPMATAPIPIDCPKCGATKSCYAMTKCPKCGTWYVRPSFRNPRGMPAQPGQDVCPNCGTDLMAWEASEKDRLRQERLGK
jgi:rubredoxin